MTKKIIHIALGKANPNRMNGVNKVIHSLISAQVEMGVDAELWGITFNTTHNYPTRNFKTYTFLDYRFKFKLDNSLKEAIKSLKNKTNHCFHLHGAFTPQLYSVARLLKKYRIPYIHTPHGGYNLKALEKSNLHKKLYIVFFERFLVNNAHGIQLIGQSEEEGLNRYFKPKKYAFIPNGQEKLLDKIPPKTKGEPLNLGYLGRIDIHTKGLDILFEALAIVKVTIEIRLSIIGEGAELIDLKTKADELGLTEFIDFKGAKFGEEKYKCLEQLDVFCLVSRNEGLPGVVLEAAAVGVPSIISIGTNMRPYVEPNNAGWILTNYNAKALAELIIDVNQEKQNHTLLEKSENALCMIDKVFSWRKIAEELGDLYA